MSQVHARSAKQTAGPRGPAARPKPRAPVRPVQRKEGGCSCGGGCPACQAEKRAESEADRVADDILANRPAGAVTAAPPPVQAKEAGGGLSPGPVPHPGPGRPLAGPARGFFEGRFGRDFSGVRIHDGPGAHASAMAINARAYTSGSDIVFARSEFAPGTRRGDHLLAHELTHVIQQRQGLASVQRVPADDEIGGAQYEVEDDPHQIFFEQGSSIIDAHESAKFLEFVPHMVEIDVAPARVWGFRSPDEPGPLALERAEEVRDRILDINNTLSVVAQGNPHSYQDRPDYRYLRRAQLVVDRPETEQDPCAGRPEFHASCPQAPAVSLDIQTAFSDALSDVTDTVSALEQFRDHPSRHGTTGRLLSRFFGTGYNLSGLISDYGALRAQVELVSRTDHGTADPPSGAGYRCANECFGWCDSSDAVTSGGGGNCLATFCDSRLNGDLADLVSLVIHEISHCTAGMGRSGGGTSDAVYAWEKAARFLTAPERADSADIMTYFVHELKHGGPDTLQPSVVDDVSAFSASEGRKVEEALARMAKWLSISDTKMTIVFNSVMDARTQGWAGLWARDIYQWIRIHLDPDNSLSAPPGRTSASDVDTIAAIMDRIVVLSNHVNGSSITAQPGSPTEWSGPSGGSSVLPGTEVQVERGVVASLNMQQLIRKILRSLMLAAPHVSDPLVRGYVDLVDFIRRREGLGP